MRLTGGMFVVTALAASLTSVTGGEKGKSLDPASLTGTWVYVSGEKDGQKVPADNLKKGTVEISKDTIKLKSPDSEFVLQYALDVAKQPARIQMEIVKGPQGEGAKTAGIIAMKDGQLLLCYPAMGGETPTAFATKEGSGLHFFTLKRKD
jgi:uncharacterized protein (TIGR03067 family)